MKLLILTSILFSLNTFAIISQIPNDQGVKIQRHLTNYVLDRGSENVGYTSTFTQDGSQPILTWDGLLYLRQSSIRDRSNTLYMAGGLAAYIIDYKNSYRDIEDRLELEQTSPANHWDQGVLVYKHLYYELIINILQLLENHLWHP
jgi:hypothetical protein